MCVRDEKEPLKKKLIYKHENYDDDDDEDDDDMLRDVVVGRWQFPWELSSACTAEWTLLILDTKVCAVQEVFCAKKFIQGTFRTLPRILCLCSPLFEVHTPRTISAAGHALMTWDDSSTTNTSPPPPRHLKRYIIPRIELSMIIAQKSFNL